MRCEGWTRKGGVFTLGSISWSQCENEAIVMLEVEQEKVEKQPACMTCWKKGIKEGIKILSIEPLNNNKSLNPTSEASAD